MVELVDTLVLEASARASEFESRLGHQTWSRSINGDAVDCKSAVVMARLVRSQDTPPVIRKRGRVRLIATVLKTVDPLKGP